MLSPLSLCSPSSPLVLAPLFGRSVLFDDAVTTMGEAGLDMDPFPLFLDRAEALKWLHFGQVYSVGAGSAR